MKRRAGTTTTSGSTTPTATGWRSRTTEGYPSRGNRGGSWFKIQLPLAQMYHVTVDNDIPYNVLGNRQDGPSTRGPSRAFTGGFLGGGIPRGMWHGVGGGESGFATPDPEDPNIIWSSASGAGAAGGIVVRYDERTRQFRQLEVWPESTMGWPAEGLRYRFQWVFPLLISPHDRNTVYVGSQHVHRTTNGGQSWEEASPDLTTNDKSRQTISGGLTPDNIGVEFCCVIYAIDESPVTEGVIWAGTNDGMIHLTRDGGANWTDVTANVPDMPVDGVVRNIDASKWEAGKAYMTVEAHQVGNFEPYVYRTEDFGESWTKIVNGVADSPLSYTRNVREDPVRPGLLYLGTENFLYVSFDDGDNWQRLTGGLPPSPMYWITVQEHFGDLVVGTYGRGFWIMDDIAPLQQWTDEVEAASVHLFQPRGAYRFHSITAPFAQFDDWSAGENPPYGAPISFWLDEAAEDVFHRDQERRRGDDPHPRDGGRGRAEPDVLGSPRRSLDSGGAADATPLRRLGGPRRGADPRGADRPDLDPRSARPVHRGAEGRGHRADGAPRGAEGPEQRGLDGRTSPPRPRCSACCGPTSKRWPGW